MLDLHINIGVIWRQQHKVYHLVDHMQAPADVKAANRGLFGMLPPELQRMGRDVFSQGRTVLNPIGRIFGGKVFPPFT